MSPRKKSSTKSASKKKSFIAYKKVATFLDGKEGRAIVKLRIPANASVVTVRGEGGKSRASRAKVLAIEPIGYEVLKLNLGRSRGDPGRWTWENRLLSGPGLLAVSLRFRHRAQLPNAFLYEVGTTVRPVEPFCKDKTQQCASGIHFFRSRAKALAYN